MVGFMAEPKLSEAITRLLNETQAAAVTVMVASHEGDRATSELWKCRQRLSKRGGQPQGPMYEIPKDDESFGLHPRAKVKQWIQRAAIPITR